MSVSDPEIRIDDATNRRVIERQVIEAHLGGLIHLVRQLDSGLLDDDHQQAHMLTIEALGQIEREVMPALFEALDMIDPIRVEMGDLTTPRPPHPRPRPS